MVSMVSLLVSLEHWATSISKLDLCLAVDCKGVDCNGIMQRLFSFLEHKVMPLCYLELILLEQIPEVIVMPCTKVQYELESVDICKRVPLHHHLFFAGINVQGIDITFLDDDVDGCTLKAPSNLTCWMLQWKSKTLATIG